MKNIIIIIFLIQSLAACNQTSKNQQVAPSASIENSIMLSDEQIKLSGIAIGAIEKKIISRDLKLNGKIEVPPQNVISLSAAMGGFIKSINLFAGAAVKQGDVLFILEDAQYIQIQQDYLTAKAKLLYDEGEFKRQKELNLSKSASDKTFELAQSNYQSQLVLTKSLEEKLRLIGYRPEQINPDNISGSVAIRCPRNGYVSKVQVNTGQYVQQGDVILEIVDLHELFLNLTAFDNDITKLQIGQKIQAYSNINPNQFYSCEIFMINTNLNKENAGEVYCRFVQPGAELIPGMFMNANVTVQSDSSFVLPADAVVSYENKSYAFIATGNNEFRMQPIETGISSEGFIQLINADALMDQPVVTSQAYTLLMAMKNTND
jgi:membrane fusion protein, heavy metal efflux system